MRMILDSISFYVHFCLRVTFIFWLSTIFDDLISVLPSLNGCLGKSIFTWRSRFNVQITCSDNKWKEGDRSCNIVWNFVLVSVSYKYFINTHNYLFVFFLYTCMIVITFLHANAYIWAQLDASLIIIALSFIVCEVVCIV